MQSYSHAGIIHSDIEGTAIRIEERVDDRQDYLHLLLHIRDIYCLVSKIYDAGLVLRRLVLNACAIEFQSRFIAFETQSLLDTIVYVSSLTGHIGGSHQIIGEHEGSQFPDCFIAVLGSLP